MTAQQRRQEIQGILARQEQPISASALAAQLGVSRQIVVGDIALLRAAGESIDATPRGYVHHGTRGGLARLVPCCHLGEAALRSELYAVVDNGGIIEDVIVENPLYGEITGQLHITNRYDADVFIEKARREPDSLLSRLTGGVHLHTLLCPDEAAFQRICQALAEQGLLYQK